MEVLNYYTINADGSFSYHVECKKDDEDFPLPEKQNDGGDQPEPCESCQ